MRELKNKVLIDFIKEIIGKITGKGFKITENYTIRETEMLSEADAKGLQEIRRLFEKALAKTKERVTTATETDTEAQKNTDSKAEGEGDKRYSIAYTTDNKPVVVVNDDLLRDTFNQKDMINVVKQSLGKIKRVPINGQSIFFISDTKNEYTNSKYTKWLKKNEKDKYYDKLRLAAHPHDIVYATTDYINEGLKHTRKDNIIDFARGTILIDISGKKYKGEVVIGFTKSGICELHDIVNIADTTFKYKKEATSESMDSKESTRNDVTSINIISDSQENVNTSDKRFSLPQNAEENKAYSKLVEKHFGTTYNWNETGYLLRNGKKLDFSGKNNGAPRGYRSIDHRDINEAFFDVETFIDEGRFTEEDLPNEELVNYLSDLSGTEAMVDFMQRGNIRIMPETGGINLSVEPTSSQYDSLSDFISRNRGEVILDIDDAKGNTIASVEYSRGTHANRVINDIKNYFANGTIPSVSVVSDFHVRYSLTQSFESQIDDVLNNNFDKNNHVYLGKTPQKLVDILGLPQLPMLMTPNHVYSCVVSANKAKIDGKYSKNVNYHDLGKSLLSLIPKELGKPFMIIKSNTDTNNTDFVVVTNKTDKNGCPVMVAVRINGKGKLMYLEFNANVALSVYAKNNIQNYVSRAYQDKRILYVNKNSQHKNTKGVQFPNNILNADYINSLTQFKRIVNSSIYKNSSSDTKITLTKSDGTVERFSLSPDQYLEIGDISEFEEVLGLDSDVTESLTEDFNKC